MNTGGRIFRLTEEETEAQGHILCKWQRSDANPESFSSARVSLPHSASPAPPRQDLLPPTKGTVVPEASLSGRPRLIPGVCSKSHEALHKKKNDERAARIVYPWLFADGESALLCSAPGSSASGSTPGAGRPEGGVPLGAGTGAGWATASTRPGPRPAWSRGAETRWNPAGGVGRCGCVRPLSEHLQGASLLGVQLLQTRSCFLMAQSAASSTPTPPGGQQIPPPRPQPSVALQHRTSQDSSGL